MSNYKLTTDLIADCMALIPKNLELLNRTTFEVRKNPIAYKFVDDNIVQADICGFEEWFKIGDSKKADFLFFSHCLPLISEFKREILKYTELETEYNVMFRDYHSNPAYYARNLLNTQPRTIWQATLFGNGTFPQTLAGLCESYKNVMLNNYV